MDDLFIYHLHSDYSSCTTNIDSATKIDMYIKKARNCGMTALAFSEHGNIFNWAQKKSHIEQEGMKYVHAIEFYLTEDKENKVRDNYHLIAIAKNWDGVKEMNKLVTISNNRTDGHFYYVPRITLSEFNNISNNIIITSACLAGPLSKGNEFVFNSVLDYFRKNNDRCYLEIQHHNVPRQIEYNKKLFELSKAYNIPLITGTDTHSLNSDYEEAREVLQRAHNTYFDNEEGWDLTFKTYEELVCSYEKQNSLPIDVVKEAIKNTCVVRDSIDSFELDTKPKYPKLYEDSQAELKKSVYEALEKHPYALKNHKREDIEKRINAELEVFHKTNMEDFMLFQTFVRKWEHENDVWVGPGRGSVSGSMVAYLLGITDMDSIKFGLNFFRFANPERQSNADIDSDYGEKDRNKTRNFLLTTDKINSAEIAAFGTIATRKGIDDVCRALGYGLDIGKEIKSQLLINEKKEEYADEKLKRKYPDIFKYVDLLSGVIVSVGTHPAGVLCATRDIGSEIGLFSLSTTDHMVSSLDMYGLDAGWWTKLDCLGLDNVDLINDTCKLAGIDRITPDNINLEDWNVWKDIREDNSCIFQYESDFGGQVLKKLFSDDTIAKIKEKYPTISFLKLFSFGNALIRPCGASIRDNAINGIFNETGVKEIDNLLYPELGYCIIQEDIMKFLMKFCGYSLTMADKARKAIAKKKGTEQLIPEIRESFIKNSKDKYKLSEKQCSNIIEPILQCILDATRYAFSWNHSDSYSFIGYACGWLRHYYPLEFIATCFNVWTGKEEKTNVVYNYAKEHGIKILSPKFRFSRSQYYMDKKTNSIYKGIESIKFLNSACAEYLFSLKDNEYKTFCDLLKEIYSNGNINSRQLEILIKLDFFSEFGNSNFLLNYVELFDKINNSKTISKDKFDGVVSDIIKKYSRETAKKYVDIDINNILTECEEYFKIIYDKDTTIKQKIEWQLEFVGYIDFKTNVNEDRTKLLILDIKELDSKKTGKAWAYATTTISIGTGKQSEILIPEKLYKANPVFKNDVIKTTECGVYSREYQGKKSWYFSFYKKIDM